jgi:moderate conductance mechanosensitive channel
MNTAWLDRLNGLLLHWGEELGQLLVIGLRITLIVVAAWLIRRMLHKAIGGLRLHLTRGMDDRESIKRSDTLGRVIRYLISVVVTLVASMLVLSEVGISLAPILGAAGVVGLAVGFGAQSLVRDYFSGFFMLLENQIRQGDVVTLAGQTGTVEEITLRYVQLRDYAGNVYVIPNGQITLVTNMTRGFGYAVIDIGVGYREDIDRVMTVMHTVARELREDAAFATRILDDLEMAGVNAWADSAVMLRARIRCQAQEQFGVRREYLKRLKKAFDDQGIEIPFPHLTVYAGDPKPAGGLPYDPPRG